MADWKLKLYHNLPPLMRNVAASWRGWQLKRWRYSSESEKLVQEALDRDKWSANKWRNYQENRLGIILNRAATKVPYYREHWAKRRRSGDNASWEYLENWPILTKQELRVHAEQFVADDCDKSAMFKEQTSGTTGTPLKLWWSHKTTIGWYALFEARIRRWNGVSINENWAILGGQQVIPPKATHPPFWVWNHPMNQLYLSANHISKNNIKFFVNAMKKYRVTHLIAYTSSATLLAKYMLSENLSLENQLRVVVTNAEPIFSWQREIMQETFQCPIRETYGMGEIVTAASADTNNDLRIWPEVGIIEVYDDNNLTRLDPGLTGKLVCTGIFNEDMPLIRYEVGDRGSISPQTPSKSDQIQLPYLGSIEGRSNDILLTADGREVFWINPIFYGLPLVEAQVIQNSIRDIEIKFVPDTDFKDSIKLEIRNRLQQVLGDEVNIQFNQVDRIPRGPNNKFKPVINNIQQSL